MLRVKQIREEKGLSKYRVCKDSGVAYTSYDAIEKGKDPRVSTLYKIAKAMGVDIKELFE